MKYNATKREFGCFSISVNVKLSNFAPCMMKNITSGILVLLCLVPGLTVGPGVDGRRMRREQPTLPPNTTTVYTKHDDIAHFTCTARDQVTISWKREKTDLKNNDLGVAMLSMKNGNTLESHLFIAVTDDDLRGKYTCISSNKPDEALQVFIIENDPAREGMLSTEDYWAIILSLVITVVIAVSLAFFLWRGNRRLKKAREESKAQRSRNNHEGAQENLAVEEEVVDIEDGKEEKKKPIENGNNNTPDLKDKPEPPLDNKTEVVIESVPNGKKANESSTNF